MYTEWISQLCACLATIHRRKQKLCKYVSMLWHLWHKDIPFSDTLSWFSLIVLKPKPFVYLQHRTTKFSSFFKLPNLLFHFLCIRYPLKESKQKSNSCFYTFKCMYCDKTERKKVLDSKFRGHYNDSRWNFAKPYSLHILRLKLGS